MPIAEITTTDPGSAAEPAALPLRWLEVYGDGLYAYAVRRLRRPELAEDLVQETLLAAVQSWDSFAGRSNVRTWLTGILRNKISDHLRARYRRPETESYPAEEDDRFDRRGRWKAAVGRWRVDPEDQAERAELRGVLDSCVDKLPKSMAHLFLSRVADQVPTDQLCDQLRINHENAWKILSRARSRLRECLTANWFADPTPSSHRSTKPCSTPSR